MLNLDIHPGVSEDHITKVGGKAAVLDSIVEKDPDFPIPPYELVDHDTPRSSPIFEELSDKIIRASSVLDLQGGFGVFESVTYSQQIYRTVQKVLSGSESDLGKRLAERRGYDEVPPLTAMVQEQTEPGLFAVVMRHPVQSDVFIVDLSNSMSMYAYAEEDDMSSNLGGLLPDLPSSIFGGRNFLGFSQASLNRVSVKLIVSNDGEVLNVNGVEKIVESDLAIKGIKRAVELYKQIESYGIIAPDVTSIMESGIMDSDNVQVYQFTPVMQYHPTNNTTIPRDYEKLGNDFIGSTTSPEGISLPVIRIPSDVAIYASLRTDSDLSKFNYLPQLKEMLEHQKEQGMGMFIQMHPEEGPQLISRILEVYTNIEHKRLGGKEYALNFEWLERSSADLLFKLPLPTAIIIDRAQPDILNHGTARMLYEAQHVFVGSHLNRTPGDTINILSNGLEAGYKTL